VRAVAWSPDGQTILTAGFGRLGQFWDVKTRKPREPLLPHQQQITSVAYSPDGQTVVTGSWDRTARLWDTVTGQPIGPRLLQFDRIDRVAFSPNGRAVATASRDWSAILWEVPAALEGDLERIRVWVEVCTRKTLIEGGLIQQIEEPEWKERQQRLESLGGAPTQ
jgi:WD40 repeat protein